jgi:hypothetical protein
MALDWFITPTKAADAEIDSSGLSSRGKMDSWDWGDRARHAIFGDDYSRGNLERLARDRQTERYNDDDNISALNTTLSQLRPGVTITRQGNETLADMQARARGEIALGNAIGEASITNPKADLSGVTSLTQLRAIVGQDTQRQTDENKRESTRKEEDSIRRYEAGLLRDHNLQLRQLNGQIAQEQARLKSEEKADLRQHQVDMRSLDNQLASFNLENARLMQQEENRRADRKEKALYTLIASLSNLGASFTI